jgi:hypothetical protein
VGLAAEQGKTMRRASKARSKEAAVQSGGRPPQVHSKIGSEQETRTQAACRRQDNRKKQARHASKKAAVQSGGRPPQVAKCEASTQTANSKHARKQRVGGKTRESTQARERATNTKVSPLNVPLSTRSMIASVCGDIARISLRVRAASAERSRPPVNCGVSPAAAAAPRATAACGKDAATGAARRHTVTAQMAANWRSIFLLCAR